VASNACTWNFEVSFNNSPLTTFLRNFFSLDSGVPATTSTLQTTCLVVIIIQHNSNNQPTIQFGSIITTIMVYLNPIEEFELAAGAIRASDGRLLSPPAILFPTTVPPCLTSSSPLALAAMAAGVVMATATAVSAELALVFLMQRRQDDDNDNCSAGTPPPIPRSIAVGRARCTIDFIFDQLGPDYARRAYRMTLQTFYHLHDLLFPSVHSGPHSSSYPHPASTKKHRNGAKNGLITSSIRLGVALRYFAVLGLTYDLAVMHGISPNEVYKSVWAVLRAVNSSNELLIAFPANHTIQQQLADGFRNRSTAGFGCCVGAIDGGYACMD
jgi:hypothetical protein